MNAVDDRQPPQALDAEMSVLGGMMLSKTAIGDVIEILAPRDFYRPAHATIYQTIIDLWERGEPADPVTVAAELNRRGQLVRLGGGPYLHTLISTVPTAANAAYYAEIVAEKATQRRLIEAGTRIVQLGYKDATGQIDELISHAQAAMDRVTRGVVVEADTPLTLDDLLGETDDPHDWLVPDLLERTDRLMLTGFEGHGKSYLIAQFALTIAAGLHPFTAGPLPDAAEGYRVLIFDVENSRRQLRRRYARMAGWIDRTRAQHGLAPIAWGKVVRIVSRPEGVDLSTPRELARIEAAVSEHQPDLVVAGPLYKLTDADIQDEVACKALVVTLDRLRIRYDFTLIMEAHAGHATGEGGTRKVRPIGSSLLLRWPEFGYGISPHEDAEDAEHPEVVRVVPWRGARDERIWPRVLKHGTVLPWEPGSEYWHRLDDRPME
jgi:KaiC/GvpD/RAD55 family RecA-like ATPase